MGAFLLASAVVCFKVLETGCRGAGGDLVAVILVFGLVGVTGTGGRGAVYASFLTTLVIGVDIENVEPVGPAFTKYRKKQLQLMQDACVGSHSSRPWLSKVRSPCATGLVNSDLN